MTTSSSTTAAMDPTTAVTKSSSNLPNTQQQSLTQMRATMQQKVHDTGINLSRAWRIQQLKALRQLLRDNQAMIVNALSQDLGKSYTEAFATEWNVLDHEITHAIYHLHCRSGKQNWMTPRRTASSGALFPAQSVLVPRPRLGPACLIIGPSNYPISLSLHPMIGALAAGNPVVLKPSELCPTCSQVLHDLLHSYFDDSVVRVIQGGAEQTKLLLQYSWGLIFFTGSSRVGAIVAQAAAQTLTPVVLELGGKCPCIVDQDAPTDMQAIANRIIWAKTLNAGQTCAAVDTVIVHASLVDKLVAAMKKTLHMQFGTPETSELGRIVCQQHAERLVQLIQQVEDHIATTKPTSTDSTASSSSTSTTTIPTQIITGGSKECNAANRYIAPTIIVQPPLQSRLVQEEIFGPVLPIIVVQSRQEAIDFVRHTMPGTPLCMYVFTKTDATFQQYVRACPAASAVRNDCLIHLASRDFPFGGLGSSGYGVYHGKYTFDTFSHMQSQVYRPCAPGFDFAMARYHPFGDDGTNTNCKTIKSWLVTNVLLQVPEIPNLHLKEMTISLVTIVMLILSIRTVPTLTNAFYMARVHLANLLEYLIDNYLRPSSTGATAAVVE